MSEQDVTARIDALARQLRTMRSIAVVLAAAVVGLGAWTIYAAVRKPETITLSSDGSSLTLSPHGISLKAGENGGAIIVENEGGARLLLTPEAVRVTQGGGVAATLGVLDTKNGAPYLTLETVDTRVEVEALAKEAGLRIHSKTHRVGIEVDETHASIDGTGPPPFTLGSEAPK